MGFSKASCQDRKSTESFCWLKILIIMRWWKSGKTLTSSSLLRPWTRGDRYGQKYGWNPIGEELNNVPGIRSQIGWFLIIKVMITMIIIIKVMITIIINITVWSCSPAQEDVIFPPPPLLVLSIVLPTAKIILTVILQIIYCRIFDEFLRKITKLDNFCPYFCLTLFPSSSIFFL